MKRARRTAISSNVTVAVYFAERVDYICHCQLMFDLSRSTLG